MKAIAAVALTLALAGCAEVSYQAYPGQPKPTSEVAVVRLWTPRTGTIFDSPNLLVEKIDGVDAGDYGRTSHAYLLPGEHTFQVHYIQLRAYHLLCGALCDAIFNKPGIFKAPVAGGHTYTLRYIDDEKATIVLDDRGLGYDPLCLEVRKFAQGKNC